MIFIRLTLAFLVMALLLCWAIQTTHTIEIMTTRRILRECLKNYYYRTPPYSLVRALKFVGLDLGLDV